MRFHAYSNHKAKEREAISEKLKLIHIHDATQREDIGDFTQIQTFRKWCSSGNGASKLFQIFLKYNCFRKFTPLFQIVLKWQ